MIGNPGGVDQGTGAAEKFSPPAAKIAGVHAKFLMDGQAFSRPLWVFLGNLAALGTAVGEKPLLVYYHPRRQPRFFRGA
jgi:hypothetical protein